MTNKFQSYSPYNNLYTGLNRYCFILIRICQAFAKINVVRNLGNGKTCVKTLCKQMFNRGTTKDLLSAAKRRTQEKTWGIEKRIGLSENN